MGEKFKYEYHAPTEKERNEINRIKNKYLPEGKTTGKYDELKKLDSKVQNPPMAVAISLGVIGLLTFGLGMTFFLEWKNLWFCGIPFALIGTIIIAIAYPMYRLIYNKLQKKYKAKILEIANELLEEENKEL